MIIEIDDCSLMNVWQEEFEKKKENGEKEVIQYYRALISVVGEAPLQFGVNKDDYENLVSQIGSVGTAQIDLDAKPGQKMRVRFLGIV